MILLEGGVIQITGVMISSAIVVLIVGVIAFLIRRSILARDKKIEAQEIARDKKIESQDKRIKSLETAHSDQRVVNKGNEDFQSSAKASDEKSQEVYKEIFTKLEGIKEFVSEKVEGIKSDFDEKFSTLTESFHQLELRMPKAEEKSGK